MICVLQVLASVCISLIEEYALTLYAHILSQIIVSINSLWPHFTGCTKFIISWQFAGWQEGERRRKCKHKTVGVGIGTWQSVRAIYHSVKLHWLLQQNYLQCEKCPPSPRLPSHPQNGWVLKRVRPANKTCHVDMFVTLQPLHLLGLKSKKAITPTKHK